MYPPNYLDEQGYQALGEDWANGRTVGSQAAGVAAAYSGMPGAPQGGYNPYLSAQLQAGYSGTYPNTKPPTFPPPQPPAGMVACPQDFGYLGEEYPVLGAMARHEAAAQRQVDQGAGSASSLTATAASARGLANHVSQTELRAHLAQQPPPPPSQAPNVPASQPSSQGPPPHAPPQMSPPGQPVPSERNEEARRKQAEDDSRAAKDRYGLLGILKVIRMTDNDMSTLALGMDLTTLGLHLNAPQNLHATFASPWSDTPARKDPEYYMPPCYYMNPPQLKTAHLQKFSLETLFYIFFNMPRDMLQAYAAAELYNRGWKYHRELKCWFVCQEDESGHSRWICFDPRTWERQYYNHHVDMTAFLSEDDVRMSTSPTNPAGTLG